ncbi:MAG: YbhB/YbcL family Raf kinase inhibitor-like protein [Clostridiaceae bacterium]
MKVTSKGIIDGIILDRYGKRGEHFNKAGIPTYSLPINIIEAPKNAVSFALILEDKDAVPVCGFSWVHWIAANITKTELEENESILRKDFIQGVNSWNGAIANVDKELAIGYGGMTPPDAPHVYELHVFALDTNLELQEGFYMNELYKAMDGHVIEQTTLKGCYKN